MENEKEFEESVVVMTDEEGNEFYYVEEEVISIGDDRFAILVPIEEEGSCSCCGGHDHDHDHEEADAIIAKIVKDENGEEVYCNPTDEEFDEVLRVYEERDMDE